MENYQLLFEIIRLTGSWQIFGRNHEQNHEQNYDQKLHELNRMAMN